MGTGEAFALGDLGGDDGGLERRARRAAVPGHHGQARDAPPTAARLELDHDAPEQPLCALVAPALRRLLPDLRERRLLRFPSIPTDPFVATTNCRVHVVSPLIRVKKNPTVYCLTQR